MTKLGARDRAQLVVFAYEYIDDIRRKTDGAYRYLRPIPPAELT